jgi:hypothetical protein
VIEERGGICADVAYGPGCDDCSGLGAEFCHEPSCDSDFCVGNGDEHACAGAWLPCASCGTMRKLA